jgi:adenine-specific DNA-methyltransferase
MFDKSIGTVPSHLPNPTADFLKSAPSAVASRLALTRMLGGLARAAQETGTSPAAAVGTLLRMWCRSEYPRLPNPALPGSRSFRRTAAAEAFVERLTAQDFLEATYWLSTAYARISDVAYRKSLAMFFTPASLTNGLLDDLHAQGARFSEHRFLDPACGGAAFLAPVALRMRDALRAKGWTSRRILRHVETHVAGYDLDSTLCELSRHFLRMALYPELSETGYRPYFDVRRANSLTALRSKSGAIDVVVCNPPYRKLTAEEVLPLRPAYGDVIEAQPNLYGVFIALSVSLLRPGGVAAIVSPTSFLSGQYFSKLRRFLAEHVRVEHIGMVSDKAGVFMDVQQETALSIFRRRCRDDQARREDVGPLSTKVSVVSPTGDYREVGLCRLPADGQVWPIPRAADDVRLLRRAGRASARLRDYGYAIRVGGFMWTRDKRPKFETLAHACRRKANSAVPLLWSRDIHRDGSLGFVESRMTHDEHRFVDMGSFDHPSVVRAPSVVLQRVTSNEQARRLICAAVPAKFLHRYRGFVGENHIVILEQVASSPVLSPEELAALLSTAGVDRYFRCISGATNVSAFELNQLALPPADALRRLLDAGIPMNQAVRQLMTA